MQQIAFKDSPTGTVGIEWEVMLVDAQTGELADAATALIAEFDSQNHTGGRAAKELLQNTVELVTSPHHRVSDAVAELREMAQLLQQIAAKHHLKLISAGCHPSARWSEQQVTENDRYRDFVARHGWWGRQMLIWGIHTHVGLADKSFAVPVMNEILKAQPLLISLTASSPFWERINTEYVSNRTMLFQQLPSAGIGPALSDWADFEETISQMRAAGAIQELNEARWDVRPAPDWGTVEARLCDGTADLQAIGAVTALVQCIAVYTVDQILAGKTLTAWPNWLLRENKWEAARFGLQGSIARPGERERVPIQTAVSELVDQLRPIAERLDCQTELEYAKQLAARGESMAHRQLAAYAKADNHAAGLTAATELLVAEFAANISPDTELA